MVLVKGKQTPLSVSSHSIQDLGTQTVWQTCLGEQQTNTVLCLFWPFPTKSILFPHTSPKKRQKTTVLIIRHMDKHALKSYQVKSVMTRQEKVQSPRTLLVVFRRWSEGIRVVISVWERGGKKQNRNASMSNFSNKAQTLAALVS